MKRITFFMLLSFAIPSFVFAQPQHCTFKVNTGDSYSIVVTAATLDTASLQAGDEICVLTPDTIVVGASVWTGDTPLALTAWIDDSQTSEVDGYTRGDTMFFKIWQQSSDTEYPATPTYAQGNGTFGDGAFASVSLAGVITAVEENPETQVPKVFTLSQNYPNPFNPETAIRYQLAQKTHVILKIMNVLGEQVNTLVDEEQNPGLYSVNWNGTDRNGRRVASGVYLYQLEAGDFVSVKKMVLTK